MLEWMLVLKLQNQIRFEVTLMLVTTNEKAIIKRAIIESDQCGPSFWSNIEFWHKKHSFKHSWSFLVIFAKFYPEFHKKQRLNEPHQNGSAKHRGAI